MNRPPLALLLSAGLLGCSQPTSESQPVALVPASALTAAEPQTPPTGAEVVPSQIVVAGCAMCMLGKLPAKGCFWAIELDGEVRLVQGDALPTDHNNHGPEGMCTVKREVTVEGWLDGDAFVATQFDLLPFEAGKHDQPDGPAH